MSSLQCLSQYILALLLLQVELVRRYLGRWTFELELVNEQRSVKIVSLTRALGTTRPNVFRSSASLTGVVSRSKQIAGTFELIHRLCVWKSLTKLVMTIILLQEENIEFVQKVISIFLSFF